MTPDGNHIVSAGGNAVRRWDRRTGQPGDLRAEHVGVRAVAVTPDGEQIISGGEDAMIRIWDSATGLLASQWATGHGRSITAVEVTPDAEQIISAGEDGTIRIWDRATGRPVGEPLTGHIAGIEAIAVTPDGEEIISAGVDGSLRQWDRHTGRLFHLLSSADLGTVQAVAVTPDGGQIICAGDGAVIRVWGRASGSQIGHSFTGHTDTIQALAVTQDDMRIISAGRDNTVRVWDRVTGQQAGEPFSGHTDAVQALLVTPDDRQIISGGLDETIRVWDIDRRMVMTGHTGPVNAVAVTPDGTQIVSAGEDGIRIWRRDSGQLVGEPLTGHTTSVLTVAVTPDGDQIISGSAGGTVRIWDRATGQQVGGPLGGMDAGRVSAVAITPDGSQIVSGGDLGLRIWDRTTAEKLAEWRLDGPVMAMAVTPDGAQIISGGRDGVLLINDRITGQHVGGPLPGHPGHTGAINAVALTPDGSQIMSAGVDNMVRLWSRVTGVPVGEPLHVSGPWAVAVTPDGSQLVVGSGALVEIWDRNTGERVRSLAGHADLVTAVAVTPDGTQIISGSDDGTVRVWDVTTLEPASRAARAYLAEVVSDLESGEDRLGITNDVHTVAAVVAALSTTPPLSVALLGDWGIGKSSFMRQVRDRVDELAAQSARGFGRRAFAANVRQVRFNAWHYSDDHLWVGLVEHLFRELATSPVEATGRINDLEAELSTRRAEQTRLEKDLRAVDRIDAQHGWLGAVWAPLRSIRVARATLRVGGWRLLLALLVVLAGVAVLILGAGLLRWLGGAFPIVVGILGVAVTVGRRLGEYTEVARRQLIKRKSEVDIDIHAVEDELSKLDPARRLDALLTEIGTADRFESYRGLTGHIHHDLRRLSDDLAAAREQWERTGGVGRPPLQRIVLYVDDLDRCTPRRVVDVLQAVNLLLTMELFVVVVAVDPRWLLRSLEQHHEGLFNDNAVAYLDKIFHVPIALRPMGDYAAGYLRSLLPSDEEPPEQPLPQPIPQPVPQQAPEVTKAPRTKSAPPAPQPAGKTPVPQQVQTPAPVNLVPRPTVDLNPEGLRLRPAEGDFLARLTPLLSTPRSIKKLVNLYRLLRLGIAEDRLDEFIGTDQGGPYQAAALLLAAMVGAPHHARYLLAELAGIAPGEDIIEAMPDSPLGARLSELIVAIRKDIPVHGDTATYRRWACSVARYGFETYDLFTGPDPA